MKVVQKIVAQHAEEASFRWMLRRAAVTAPHYRLLDLHKLDDLVDANLDGLAIAKDVGWELCREELEWREAGEVFTAGAVAIKSGRIERFEAVADAAKGELELELALSSALGWIDWDRVSVFVEQLMNSAENSSRRIGLSGAVVHRRLPSSALMSSLSCDDLELRARAIRSAGEMGMGDALPVVKSAYASDSEDERFWAAWSGVLLGDLSAGARLLPFVRVGGCRAELACVVAMRQAVLEDSHRWQRQLADDAGCRRVAIMAAGAIGDPVLVEWIIEMMSQEPMARVAGEAFSMITGLDLSYEDFEANGPEDFEAGANDNPDDHDVSLDRDEDLPWPDAEKLKSWWTKNRAEYQQGKRYLCGELITAANCEKVLREGYQRQRMAAAQELVLMKPRQSLVDTSSSARHQMNLLALSRKQLVR